jgi:O-methyltransferase involved in polyketide biosynthesis
MPVPEAVTFVAADLAADSLAGPLLAAGFDTAAPALVSWLGVTMYLTPDAVAGILTAVGRLAPGTELIADYMLPAGLRDEAGAVYGELVARASAERGEPWLSCFAPGEMTDMARRAGFREVRNVRQRGAIPAGLWQRPDSLRPADLAVLFHGAV